jgi:hypothetical protein
MGTGTGTVSTQPAYQDGPRIPLPIGKKATLTLLHSSHANNKRHTLMMQASPTFLAGVADPTTPASTAMPTVLGPFTYPVMLTLYGMYATSPSPTAGNTWSWTRATKVDTTPQQWVIDVDDSDKNGAYLDIAVALVID